MGKGMGKGKGKGNELCKKFIIEIQQCIEAPKEPIRCIAQVARPGK
jgi:hypothetical protein